MKKVYQYILKSFAGPMILAFFIVLFIFLMQMMFVNIDQLVGKGLGMSVISEFMFWAVLTLIPMTLPLAVLFASIMTMGNLGGNNELLALKSAGLSLNKILRPMFVVAILISIFAFYVSNNLMPYSKLKISSLFYDIKNTKLESHITPNVFTNLGEYVIRVNTKNPNTGKMTGIMLYNHPQNKGNISITIADSGYAHTDPRNSLTTVTLYNSLSYDDVAWNNFNNSKNTFEFRKRRSAIMQFIIDMSGDKMKRTDDDLFKDNSSFKKTSELNVIIDSVQKERDRQVNIFWNAYSTSQVFDDPKSIDTALQHVEKGHTEKNKRTIFFNTDSAYNAYSIQKKNDVMKYALEKIETAKNNTENLGKVVANNQKEVLKARVEWHYKFALSVSCFIFFLIGAPLGALIRKGGLGMPTVASLLLFLSYFIFSTITKKMALQSAMSVTLAMWLPNIIFLPLGLFLLYKATTDSALFNAEAYKKFFRKLFHLEDNQNYHAPSQITQGMHNIATIKSNLKTFNEKCKLLLEQVHNLECTNSNVVQFYSDYDNIICQLWGLQNESLNEKLKEYPEIAILKYKKDKSKHGKYKELIKKLDTIMTVNSNVEYILEKIKW